MQNIFIKNILGSGYKDDLTGDSNTNIINGGSDDDILDGASGSDTLYGDAGNDTLYGGLNDNVIDNLYGGLGNDTFKVYFTDDSDDLNDVFDGDNIIDGYVLNGSNQIQTDNASDRDTLDYSAITDSDYHLELTLADGTTQASAVITDGTTTTHKTDTVVNIENVIGTSGDDTITGNSEENTLKGGSGDDELAGGAGIDYLYGESGADNFVGTSFTGDVIDGGSVLDGTGDTIDYSDMGKITLVLEDNGAITNVNLCFHVLYRCSSEILMRNGLKYITRNIYTTLQHDQQKTNIPVPPKCTICVGQKWAKTPQK